MKQAELCLTLDELDKINVSVDVIAIQETRVIRYPELVNVPGIQQFISNKQRKVGGGGRF